jgi:hypothetical protein
MEGFSLTPDFEESLKCPICSEFYTVPIYLCPKGHSICSACENESEYCPVCKSLYNKETKNHVLGNILNQIKIKCKFQGCDEYINLASRNQHYSTCRFNNLVKCHECLTLHDDLLSHLVRVHEYKELHMEERGGLRSFSGPCESWIRDTEWPKGIWRLGKDAVVVNAKSSASVFHIYLFRITPHPLKLKLKVNNPLYSIAFKGVVPEVNEFNTNNKLPHFNCHISQLLDQFVTEHEEDREILRLWIEVKRKN